MAHRLAKQFGYGAAIMFSVLGAVVTFAQPPSPPGKRLPVPSNVPAPDATPAPAPTPSILDTLTPASREVAIKRAKWVFRMPDGLIVDYWSIAMTQDFIRRFVRFDGLGEPFEEAHVQETPETIALRWAESARHIGEDPERLPEVLPPTRVAWRNGVEEARPPLFTQPISLYIADPTYRNAKNPFVTLGTEVAPGIFEMTVRQRSPWGLRAHEEVFVVRLRAEQAKAKRLAVQTFFLEPPKESETIGGMSFRAFQLIDADVLRMKPEQLADAVLQGEMRLVDWTVKSSGKGRGPQDYRWTPEFVELHSKEKPPEPKPVK